MRARLALLLLAAAGLAGCADLGRKAPALAPQLPARYAEAPDAGVGGQPQLQDWWKLFGDAELSRLVDRALAANLDLAQTAERIRQARQDEIIANAGRLPQVNADANASRERISKNAIPLPPGVAGHGSGAGGASSLFGLPGSEFNEYQAGLDASWQVDLFGGTKSAVEGARARTGSAVWSRRDLEVSIAAEVAASYLDLRSLQRRERIAWDELSRQRQLLSIVRARADAGFVSRLDERQQLTQVAAAEARAYPLEAAARAEIHALGVLVGQTPEALSAELTPAAAAPATPAPPPGLPSDLLRRRPDVRRAEQDVAAAGADVGVAAADLYPKLTLSAQPDFVSTALSSLVDWSSRSYTLSAGVLWPVLDAGRLRAALTKADAREQEMLLAYRQTVLTGLREVEDALARYQADDAQCGSLAESLRQARDAESLARDQYGAGLAGYANVLSAEQAVTEGEDQLAQAEAARAQDVIGLYRALGGGWNPSDPKEMTP